MERCMPYETRFLYLYGTHWSQGCILLSPYTPILKKDI